MTKLINNNNFRSSTEELSADVLQNEIFKHNITNEMISALILQRKLKCGADQQESPENDGGQLGLYCPKIFDGWNCWNETPAGSTAYSPCPYWIPGFVSTKFGHKECLSDGTWFRRADNNRTWSNYTNCVDMDDLEWRRMLITFYETGYFISICALIISLIIFCSFKCLECTRVRIHKHLFVSFIISNILWMAFYRLVVDDPDVVLRSPPWCKILHVLVHYFMVANYFWMFCEGFYLHTLLVLTFIRSDSQLLKGFYFFGWIGPIIPISFYASFRVGDDDKNQACWMEESSWNYILSVPVCISLILSLAFLINILRVLVKKLKDNQRNFTNVCRRNSSIGAITDSHLSLKKAVRATLILIPLLGLHYLLIPFRPNTGTQHAVVYDLVSAAVASLQGFSVSLLFCFCNAEVLIVFRRKVCHRLCNCIPKSPTLQAENSCAPTSMSCHLKQPVTIYSQTVVGCSSRKSSQQYTEETI